MHNILKIAHYGGLKLMGILNQIKVKLFKLNGYTFKGSNYFCCLVLVGVNS